MSKSTVLKRGLEIASLVLRRLCFVGGCVYLMGYALDAALRGSPDLVVLGGVAALGLAWLMLVGMPVLGVIAVLLAFATIAGLTSIVALRLALKRTPGLGISLVRGPGHCYRPTVGDTILGSDRMGAFRWLGQVKAVNASLGALVDIGVTVGGFMLLCKWLSSDSTVANMILFGLVPWAVFAPVRCGYTGYRVRAKLQKWKTEALDPDNLGRGIVDVDSRVEWLTSRTHWLVAQYSLGWVHPGESAAATGWKKFWSEDVTSLQALDEAEFDAFLAKQYRIQNFALVSKKGWEVLMAHQAVDTISDPLRGLRSHLRSKEGWSSKAGSTLRAMCEDSYQSKLEFELGAAVGFEFNCSCGAWLSTEAGRSSLAGVVDELRELMNEAEVREWACAQSKAQVLEQLERVACFWEEVLKAV